MFEIEEIKKIKKILQTLMKDRDGKFYFWIVCDSHQIKVDDDIREMELKILNLTKAQSFQHQILRRVMRCTSNLFQHYEQWTSIEKMNKPLIYVGNREVIPNNQNLRLTILGEEIIDRTKIVKTSKLNELDCNTSNASVMCWFTPQIVFSRMKSLKSFCSSASSSAIIVQLQPYATVASEQ